MDGSLQPSRHVSSVVIAGSLQLEPPHRSFESISGSVQLDTQSSSVVFVASLQLPPTQASLVLNALPGSLHPEAHLAGSLVSPSLHTDWQSVSFVARGSLQDGTHALSRSWSVVYSDEPWIPASLQCDLHVSLVLNRASVHVHEPAAPPWPSIHWHSTHVRSVHVFSDTVFSIQVRGVHVRSTQPFWTQLRCIQRRCFHARSTH